MAAIAQGVAPASRRFGASYLAALLVAPILYELTITLFGDKRRLGVLPWSLVALYGAALVAVVLWVRFRSMAPWRTNVRLWLMLGVTLWLYEVVTAYVQGVDLVGAAGVIPLTFFLILLKPPSRTQCWNAADAFAFVLVVASILVLVLEVAHAIPDWYAAHGAAGAARLPYDRDNYWLPLNHLLGMEGRWGGVAGLPGMAGHTGAFLVVFGLLRPRWRRWVFVPTGIAILLLTDSRTSYAAAAVGLCVLAALPGWGRSYWRMTPTRIVAIALGLMFAVRVLAKVIVDPSLTGRLSVWPEFFALVRGFLPFGIGDRGINQAIEAGDLPDWAFEGHNVFLDTFVRYGIIGLSLVLLFVALGGALTLAQARREVGVGLAVIAALVVACLGDKAIDFVYPSVGMSVLLVGVLISQRDREAVSLPAPSRAEMG